MSLLLWRGMGMMLVLLIAAWFYLPTAGIAQRNLLANSALLFVALLVVQVLCLNIAWPKAVQLFLQFGSDVAVVTMLVVATGGFDSPFVLLFGLIIVAAGTQAEVLLVLGLAVFACMGYLSSIYVYAWWQSEALPVAATLNLLLQCSVLMLVGGVMALIARRHAGLRAESSRVVQEHRDLQALHTRLMGLMQEGVLVLDEQLCVQDSNPAAWKILHIKPDSKLDFSELWPAPREVLNFLKHPNGDSFRCEWQRDEAEYLVTVGRFPELRIDATWWLTFVDVSEIRSLERRFVEHEKLAAMGRMTAMVAHELRNPMQTIGQAVELLSKVPVERQQSIQHIVSEEVARLNRLVSDMLDYTKPLTPQPKLTDMEGLLDASLEQVDEQKLLAIHKKLTIQTLYLDAGHLRLVLDNLLRNAVLASPDVGSVSVELCEKGPQWQLIVTDHGEGIAKELQQQIFEPFDTHRTGGTGLGLATVWQVCQVNQWQIEVQSEHHTTAFIVQGARISEEQYG